MKSARINANMTQDQLARRMGVHRNTIANWEAKPYLLSIEKAEKVCDVLGVSISDIFFGKTLQNVEFRGEISNNYEGG